MWNIFVLNRDGYNHITVKKIPQKQQHKTRKYKGTMNEIR